MNRSTAPVPSLRIVASSSFVTSCVALAALLAAGEHAEAVFDFGLAVAAHDEREAADQGRDADEDRDADDDGCHGCVSSLAVSS